MQPRFNFYDFVGYIIPGTLGTLFTVAFLNRVLGVGELSLDSISGFSGTLLFLILIYFVGHVIQALGRIVEQKEVERWGGWPSERFLRPEDTRYSSEFKEQLLGTAMEYFTVKPVTAEAGSERIRQWRQELFGLCYALIVQKGVAQHTETYNGIYGLWRGLLVSFYVGFWVFLVESLKHVWWIASIATTTGGDGISRVQLEPFALSVIATLFFGMSLPFARSRFKHFGERFVDSVYRNFLAYYQSTKEVR